MSRKTGFRSHKDQEGAALIVVLLLLIIVTLLGLASMRGAIMQERMAGMTLARARAFEAAEAGLRQAELVVRDGNVGTAPSACAAGRCPMPDLTAAPPWVDDAFWATSTGTVGYATGTAVGSGKAASLVPKYVIEDFGKTSSVSGSPLAVDMSKPTVGGPVQQKIYRITSYASTPNGVAVKLQSTYKR